MTEYIINFDEKTFAYRAFTDEISIATQNLDMLSDNELTEFMSDCLIHEYVHKVLYALFDGVVSKLFDGIEYLFRNDELHERTLESPRFTYQSFIKKQGFNKFLDYYNLDKQDVINANILCQEI